MGTIFTLPSNALKNLQRSLRILRPVACLIRDCFLMHDNIAGLFLHVNRIFRETNIQEILARRAAAITGSGTRDTRRLSFAILHQMEYPTDSQATVPPW